MPLVPAYILCAIYTRRLLYFTAVNPSIHMGGFFGEQKNDIMELVPNGYKCKEILVKANAELSPSNLKDADLSFPLFAKPNVGERGFEVREMSEWEDLRLYATKGFDFVIQEKLDQPLELGVLFHSTAQGGNISSLCIKEFMKVKGDGLKSVNELILDHPRHRLYHASIVRDHPDVLDNIPERGEYHVVHKIGNHCKGTRFRNGNDVISKEMMDSFAKMFIQIEGVEYGRFDVKTESIQALEQGNFKVFELNGVSAEPGHIYDYKNVFFAYRDLYKHWFVLGKLAKKNIKKGVKTTPFLKFFQQIYNHFLA